MEKQANATTAATETANQKPVATTKRTRRDGEYRVRLFIDGEYQPGADYFTDDLDDAKATAKSMERDAVPVVIDDAESLEIAKSEMVDYVADGGEPKTLVLGSQMRSIPFGEKPEPLRRVGANGGIVENEKQVFDVPMIRGIFETLLGKVASAEPEERETTYNANRDAIVDTIETTNDGLTDYDWLVIHGYDKKAADIFSK